MYKNYVNLFFFLIFMKNKTNFKVYSVRHINIVRFCYINLSILSLHFWTNIKIRFRQSFVKFVFSDKTLGFFFISNTCIYFFQFANRKFLFWTVNIKSISSSDYSFKINKVSRKTPDFLFHAYCVTMKKL